MTDTTYEIIFVHRGLVREDSSWGPVNTRTTRCVWHWFYRLYSSDTAWISRLEHWI